MHYLLACLLMIPLLWWHVFKRLALYIVPRRLRSKKSIRGCIVLITGAGSGVGRELAVEFSKHAVCLVLVDINRPSLLLTQKQLNRCSTVFVYDCDVSDHKKVYQMAEEVKRDAGEVDILVNNAGVVVGRDLLDLSEEEIRKTMDVNALAHFWMCKAFLPSMMEKNKGHIVSVTSGLAKVGSPRLTDYCASKFAAQGFAQSLELELQAKQLDGIKVTTVCPSFIDTGLFEGVTYSIGESLTAEYVAREVVAGVLEDEETVFLPHYFKFNLAIIQNAPRSLLVKVAKMTGMLAAMDTFTGRRDQKKTL